MAFVAKVTSKPSLVISRFRENNRRTMYEQIHFRKAAPNIVCNTVYLSHTGEISGQLE